MKCKRLCAWLLCLVMMFSLLPVSAAAVAEIPAEYKPTIEWTDIGGGIYKYTLTVNVYYEGKYVGKVSSSDKHLSAEVTVPSTMEVQKYEVTGQGCTYSNVSKLFTFLSHVFGGSTEGTLNLYLRSKAGHTVTVNYVYTDDESKNSSKSENVKYAEEKPFGTLEKDYGHEITVSSGDAKYEVDSLDVLRVTGGAKDSEITVTYTPKNVIYIDQYYDNGSSLVKWNNTHITLNGPELLNGAAEAAVIEKTVLTDDMKDYRFLTVKDVTYDFSFACLFPRQSDKGEITDLWYKDKADPLGYHWFYSRSGKTFSIPWGQSELSKGAVNFCYNTPHSQSSEYHDFVATTVDPTCTEPGYTLYKCKYCGKEGQSEYIPSLGGHLWGDYKQDKNTKEKDSQHYQVCQREGCNATSTPVGCSFDPATTETGTHTCAVCGYSYTDEVTPTETPKTPVYVYFRTVDTAGIPIKNDVKDVKHNVNGKGWATLGKLTTTTDVATAKAADIGKEVTDAVENANGKFLKHSDNEDFNLALISNWVGLTQNSGAAGYEREAPYGTYVWHLDGKVTAYRAIYLDSDGKELTDASSKYYLKGADGIEVSTEQPTAPAGKEFDCWVTNDVTVKNNAFKMPDHDVTFTAKWKTGTLEIEKILDEKSPAAANTFRFTVTPQGSTTGTDARITGEGNATIPILPVCNYTVEEDSSTAAVSGYRCTTQYSIDKVKWQEAPITVSVASNATVTVYVKNSYTPITADLIDNDIIIKHGVNDDPVDDVSDSTAHIVNKNAKISYQATLDMSKMMFSDTPEHKETVNGIKLAMVGENKSTIWDYMQDKDISTFAGSAVNLYVKFSDKLDTSSIDWSKLSLTSDWFRLADDYQNGLTQDSNGYWTIPCVIKGEKGTGNSSKITLSGVSLPLTPAAQGELSSDTPMTIKSEGYIDGTIKISAKISNEIIPYELSLIGMSKEAPAKNTAKLKLATYTVTYDANGGSGTMTDTNSPYAYEVVAKVLTNGFTRSRYTFTGWNTKADGSGKPYAEGDSIEMLGDVVLYAQWTRNSSHDDDDSKTCYYFAIQKVDAQDGHALNGAKFELYLDGKQVATATSNRSGIAMFRVNESDYRKINAKSNLYYQELTAPEGYVVNSDEVSIKKIKLTTSWSKAEKDAEKVRNYRGTTPDLLNGDDHFAYVVGYQDGCVHPNALITRAETATIFFRLLKDSVRDGNLLTSNTFADVPNAYWANTAISTMAGLGIVQGYNSTAFDPNASITRAEFAAICARFDTGKSSGTQTFTDIKGHWAEKYIERAAELGWIKGFEDGTFRPNDCITRAQAMTMINRVLNRIPEDASDLLPDMNVWPDCNPGDWFYLAVQEATNSHDYKHKAGNYETWTGMSKDPDWTRYEN